MKYTLNPKPEKSVRVFGRGLRISTKYSTIVCRAITGMNLGKGKGFLEDLISQKRSLGGKYYTNISDALLGLLKSAEANAEFKGLDADRMIIHASAHKGFTFWRPRRLKMRRTKRKATNIQIVLEER